jgi:hypothetical protein
MKYIQLAIFAAILACFAYGWVTRINAHGREGDAAVRTDKTDAPEILTRQASPHLPEAGPQEPPPTLAPGSFIDECLDYIYWSESRNGADPKCFPGEVGPAGELGPWQVTPIYRRDIKRLTGVDLDPYDNDACRDAARAYLEHYMRHTTVTTPYEAHELYKRGLTGYREWKVKR